MSLRRSCLHRSLLTFVVLSCIVGCPADPRQTVVLTVQQAPEWATAGATVEVRDEHDAVLLTAPLETPLPALVDVEAPTTARKLSVAVRQGGHEAHALANIDRGYARCELR